NWGPKPGRQRLADSLVDVWSPFEFKPEETTKGLDNVTEMKSYLAEFGCEKLVLGVLELPQGGEDQLDDSLLDQIIYSAAYEAEGRNMKLSLGKVTAYKSNGLDFHFTKGRTRIADIRIDVALADNRVFIFTIAVPHGMLESKDIKRFVGSYSIH